jgi:cell division protein FtsL
MHNETNATQVEEPVKKTSKLEKLKYATSIAAVYGAVIGVTGYSTYISFRIMKMNYETAKLNLEVAKEAAGQ